MAENIVRVVDPDDPNRCKAGTNMGQCPNLAVKNGFCPIHFGVYKNPDIVRNYAINRWQAKLDSKATSPNIKSLRDEIGILRMLLEERLNLCNDSQDLLFHSQAINNLVVTIDKVVKSCHSIEASMGTLLDKTQAVQLASEIITIIAEVFHEYPELINEAANRIATKWQD